MKFVVFFQYLSFPSPHLVIFMKSCHIGRTYRVHHKFAFFEYAIIFFVGSWFLFDFPELRRKWSIDIREQDIPMKWQNEIVIYSIIPFSHV